MIYCDYCVDTFEPVEYTSVNYEGLNFCTDECERDFSNREEYSSV